MADERIAWTHIVIPPEVLQGKTVDQWFDLNGKQGDGKEGTVNIILKLESQVPLSLSPPLSILPLLLVLIYIYIPFLAF